MKKVYIGAAVVAILLAVAVLFFVTGIKEDNYIDTTKVTEVVVAVATIEEGQVISSDMIQMAAVPNVSLLEGTFKSASDVVGKIAAGNIYSGEQITDKRAVEKTSNLIDKISYTVEEGCRAVTFLVTEKTGTGFYIRPGDLVDMAQISTSKILSDTIDPITGLQIPYSPAEGETESVFGDEVPDVRETKMLLEKCLVLAVGTYQDNQPGSLVTNYTSVTLQLPVDDALLYLFEASMADEIVLLLRNPDDQGTTQAEFKAFVSE